MAPNTSIVLAEGDDSRGHNFSGVYLKYRGGQIVSDIQEALGRLAENNVQSKESPCLAPPKLTMAHKVEGVILSVIDPTANIGKDAIVIASVGIYQTGKALAQGVYSLTNLLAGAVASVLPEDDKPPIKTYSLWVDTDNNQPATLTADKPASSAGKLKQAEESLQDLQKQLFVLQVAQTSRFNLDGAPAVEETPMSRRDLGLDTDQPKFIAAIYPGFGGGGDAVNVSSNSSSSSAESSSSSNSISSSSSSSSSLPAEEAGSSSAPDTTPPIISSFIFPSASKLCLPMAVLSPPPRLL